MLKYWAYKKAHRSRLCKFALRVLARWFLSVDCADHRRPFYVVITVDVEPGHVDRSERRVWEYVAPNDSVGYKDGLHNLKHVFDHYCIPATFFISNQCGKDIVPCFEKGGVLHELGFHLHPGDRADSFKLDEQVKRLRAGKKMIRDRWDYDAVSFRWGAWGANQKTFAALDSAGFRFDSSVCPGCHSLRRGGAYDWRGGWENRPSILTRGGVVEIPASTFKLHKTALRADPIYSDLLKEAFKKYYESGKGFFVVSTHSSEATYEDGECTDVVRALEEFILYTAEFRKVRFVTLRDLPWKEFC